MVPLILFYKLTFHFAKPKLFLVCVLVLSVVAGFFLHPDADHIYFSPSLPALNLLMMQPLGFNGPPEVDRAKLSSGLGGWGAFSMKFWMEVRWHNNKCTNQPDCMAIKLFRTLKLLWLVLKFKYDTEISPF